MVMNRGRGNAKQNGAKNDVGSRHGMAKEGRCRQTQLADELAGTGLAAKQPADAVGRPLAVFNGGWWRECGGAGHSEGGLGPT